MATSRYIIIPFVSKISQKPMFIYLPYTVSHLLCLPFCPCFCFAKTEINYFTFTSPFLLINLCLCCFCVHKPAYTKYMSSICCQINMRSDKHACLITEETRERKRETRMHETERVKVGGEGSDIMMLSHSQTRQCIQFFNH